jgi:hypothetical protein
MITNFSLEIFLECPDATGSHPVVHINADPRPKRRVYTLARFLLQLRVAD